MTYRRGAGSTEAVLTDVPRLIAPAEIEAPTDQPIVVPSAVQQHQHDRPPASG
jgi:hypothetical protein